VVSNGLFVVFDGTADSGKSQIIAEISSWLKSENILTHEVNEPASGEIGEICRKYANQANHPYTLACLIAAGRYKNLTDEVIPYQTQGYVILGHRYLASNYVYQIMHGVEKDFIDALNTHIVVPDITFIVTSGQKSIESRRRNNAPVDLFQASEFIRTEIQLFEDAIEILRAKGHIISVVNNDSELSEAVTTVKNTLKPLIEERQNLGMVRSMT
jgi:dTMP kinase